MPGEIQALSRIAAEIRDAQRLQLARQEEALALQRERLAILQRQAERAERLQDRSAQMITGARRAPAIVLPTVVVLIGYLSWLLFR